MTEKMAIVSLLSVSVWACAGTDAPAPTPFSSGAGAGAGGGVATGGGAAGARSYVGLGGSSSTVIPSTAGVGVSAGTGGSGAAAGGAGTGGAGSAGIAGVAGAATGGFGTGGTAGAGGSLPLPSVCDGAATRVLSNSKADALVDDFEGAMLSPNWSHFSDVMPVPNSFEILRVTTEGAATTTKSGRYKGTGAKSLPSGGYGVGIVYNVAIIKAQGRSCVDVSAFDGVSFWAKAGTDGASVDVNFVVPATNAIKDGGDCAADCYNHPRKRVDLTTTWAQYTVKFSEIFDGSAPVTGHLQMVAFLVPEAETWDYSLDEIAWFKGTAPSGPVGP